MNHFSVKARKAIHNMQLDEPGVIEPGVEYLIRSKPYIHVTYFANLPMVDWDWPDSVHPEECVTIESLADVVKMVTNYLAEHKQHVRIYLTPSGVHAFFLARPLNPSQFEADSAVLNCDPLYQKLTLERGGFTVRVTPKQRPCDFIVVYALTLANCEADPELARMLDVHHDQRISEYFNSNRGLKTQTALSTAADKLHFHMSCCALQLNA